jgi:hypothetical protein
MSALDNTLRKGLNISVFANTFIVTGPSNLQFLTAQTIFSGIYLKIAWSGGAGVLSKSQQMKVLFLLSSCLKFGVLLTLGNTIAEG